MHHSNIQRWMMNEMIMLPFKRGKMKRKNEKGQGRKPCCPTDVEHDLAVWVLEQRDKHVPISTRLLRAKAMSLMSSSDKTFKACESWARRFRRRHNLVLRAGTSIAQKLPKDLEEKLSHFPESIRQVRANSDIPYHLIGNMDETPVFFDMVPPRTLESTKSKKKRVTAVLAFTATGSMLSPMIIFKGKKHHDLSLMFKGRDPPLLFFSRRHGWMSV